MKSLRKNGQNGQNSLQIAFILFKKIGKTILHFQIDSGWMIQKKAKVDSQVGLGGEFWGTNQQV